MHAVLLEPSVTAWPALRRNSFQSLKTAFNPSGVYRFHTYQRAFDVGLMHGVEIIAIFAASIVILGKEHHVLWQLGHLFHQLEALCTNGRQLFELGCVCFARGPGGDRSMSLGRSCRQPRRYSEKPMRRRFTISSITL